jgi:hypothetical protein
MSVRSYLAQVLQDSSGLAELGLVPGAVIAGDVDTPQPRPFINLKWMITTPGIKDVVTRRSLNVWFHDRPNDYTRIDDMLFVVRSLFFDIEGVDHGSGHITVVEWLTDSQDLRDYGHGTIAKYSTYRIICSEGTV